MTTGFILLVVGLVVAFLAFCFASWSAFQGLHRGTTTLGDFLPKYFGSMVAIVLGGLCSILGISVIVASYIGVL